MERPERRGGNERPSGGDPDFIPTVLECWSIVEADFWREYRIDITADLGRISWRRFLMLLGGLSGSSRLAARLLAKDGPRGGSGSGGGPRRVIRGDDVEAVESLLKSLAAGG